MPAMWYTKSAPLKARTSESVSRTLPGTFSTAIPSSEVVSSPGGITTFTVSFGTEAHERVRFRGVL